METEKKEQIIKNELYTSTLVYFISAVLFVILDILSAFKCFSFMGVYGQYIVNGFIQIGIMFLIPLTLYKLITKKKVKTIFTEFNYKSVSPKTVGYSFLMGIVAYFGVVIISVLSSSILAFFGYNNPFVGGSDNTSSFPLMLLSVLLSAVLPALCEEFINRGLLLNGTKKFGAKKAIFFSALLFALLHFNINQAVYAFVMGLLLGSITLISGSIIPAIIIHFTNNFSSIFYGYLGGLGGVGKIFDNFTALIFSGNIFLVMIKAITVMLIVIVVIAFCSGKIFLIEKNRKLKSRLIKKSNENNDKTVIVRNAEGKTVNSYSAEELINAREEAIKEYRPQDLYDISKNKKSLWDFLFGDSKPCLEETKPIHQIFLVGSIVLASLMTGFTLIWGLI